MTEAYAETSVSGEPFEPVHGSGVTAAEMILDEPSAVRRDLKNERRLAASEDECGFPAPDSFGYSYAGGCRCQYGGDIGWQKRTCPVDINACFQASTSEGR